MSLVKQGMFLALGLFAFAVLIAAMPSKSANAQEGRIAIGFEVTKVCVGGVEGPFDIEVELEIGELVLAEGDFDIDCNETVVVCIAEGRGDDDDDDDNGPPGGDDDDDDDNDLAGINAIVDVEDCDVFLDVLLANEVSTAQLGVITVVEVDVEAGVEVTYGGDCSLDGEIELEDELDLFLTLECVITNTGAPDVSVTKVCPAGVGDGAFTVAVDGSARLIACGSTVEFDDVEGDVTITETIAGDDDYSTIIACAVNGTLVVSQPGRSVTLQDIDFGDEVTCAIFNTLVVGGVTPPVPTLPQIINIINQIEVINVVENNNTNTNVNQNENNNTQNQTNNQSTNVTATGGTANVHVDADDDKKHATHAAAAPRAATGAISPPKAGDAGLAGGSDSSSSALVVVAGVVVAMAGLGTAARLVRR